MVGRILWDNFLRTSSVIEDIYTVSGFDASKSLDGRTTTFTMFNPGISQIVYDLGSQKNFNTLCIARHNIGPTSGYFLLYGSNDNITYTPIIGNTYPQIGKNIFVDLGGQFYRYVRFTVSDFTKQTYLADISVGQALEMQRSQKHGFIRPGLVDDDVIISNVTRGRELAGLSVIENMQRIIFDLPYYTKDWLDNWKNLTQVMKWFPIYIIWDINRNDHPFGNSTGGEPAFYCWPTKKVPEPRFSKNINGYYDIKMDMTGFWL